MQTARTRSSSEAIVKIISLVVLGLAKTSTYTTSHSEVLSLKLSAFIYSPYGYTGEQTPRAALIGFNGNWYDPPAGTYALGQGYRYYSPAPMRFYSPDHLSPFGKGGYNAYAYCACDPLNFRDDTGQHRTFARLQHFWESQSRQPIQQVAPRTIKPAVQAIANRPLKASAPALALKTRKKTVSFNLQPQTHRYPAEPIADIKFREKEIQSLSIYIEAFRKRIKRKKRILNELNDPSTLHFALSQGFDENRYNIEKLKLAVWLKDAQYRIRRLNNALKTYMHY